MEQSQRFSKSRLVSSSSYRVGRSRRLRLNHALRTGLGFMIFSALISLVFFNQRAELGWLPREQGAGFSMGAMSVMLSFISIFTTSIQSYRLFAYEVDAEHGIIHLRKRARFFYIGRLTIAFLMTVLATAFTALFFLAVELMFTGSRIPTELGIVTVTAFQGALTALTAYYVSGLGTHQMIYLLAVLLAAGLGISFSIAEAQDWWQRSISYLGIDPRSGIFFSILIVMVGLISLTISRDITDDLSALAEAGKFPRRGFVLVRAGLLAICIGIIGIGVFPTSVNPLTNMLHHACGTILAVVLISGMLLMNWVAPDAYSEESRYLSFLMGMISVGAVSAFYFYEIISFVVLELILFTMFVIWVYFFKTQTEKYISSQLQD